MKSEKTLDDTACMDSMFTMSIRTPRRYILEPSRVHTHFGKLKGTIPKLISVACTVIDHSISCNN